MKKLIISLSLLPLIATALVIQFMPGRVPMHYDLSGNIDRWGSKYELMIFPSIIFLIGLAFAVTIASFEKKEKTAPTDRERASALANRKVTVTTSLLLLVFETAMQAYWLVNAYLSSNSGAGDLELDMLHFTALLGGIMLIVAGNVLPKTKLGSNIGLRVSWSEYNDVTWQKSNRFGGIALVCAGVLSVVSTAFSNSTVSIILMLVYLTAALIVTLVYAHKVYTEEKAKSKE